MVFFFIQVFTIGITGILIAYSGECTRLKLYQVAYEILVFLGTCFWGLERLNSIHPISILIVVFTCLNFFLLIRRAIEMKKDHDLFGD